MFCISKYILAILFVSTISSPGFAQSSQNEPIKKEIAKIRQTTNWENASEAKAANEKIRELSRKLVSGSNTSPFQKPASKDEEAEKQKFDNKLEVLRQVSSSAAKGETADILLADEVRTRIKEEYVKDEAPKVQCAYFQDEMTVLLLDMDSPGVQAIIDVMHNFKSIKVLIISGGVGGTPANLGQILAKASNYPLDALSIVNFKGNLTKLPAQVSQFKNLKSLSLFNNNIKALSAEIESISSLRELYVDLNPITSISAIVLKMSLLNTLGIAKTNIPLSEIETIKKQLPNCKILSR